MENKYFSHNDSLLDITDKFPETIPVFVSRGFSQMADDNKRKVFGRSVNLKTAMALKKLNAATFGEMLVERIEQSRAQVDSSLNQLDETQKGDLEILGLLPCPVRIPLMEKLEEFLAGQKEEKGVTVSADLKAASMGLDWLKERLVNETQADGLADLFISAGFDLFFDEKLMGKFKKSGTFADSTGLSRLNRDFDNDNVDLKDPARHYSMIGVVPAVFLVNTEELNGRPVPRSWKDILAPEFEKSISLPIGDFDLFNAILLNLHKLYGEEAILKLGKSLMQSMHPSQMVKSHIKKAAKPAVTIMPYFFTKMVKEGGVMEAVWPEDGAVISPIFMLSKKDKLDKLQPLIDFFVSPEVGEILAHKGLFPSIHPDVDNRLEKDNKFMWLGWDYIYKNDVAGLISHCETLFNSALAQEVS